MNAREEYENISESTENRSISGEVRVVPNREDNDIRHSVLVSSLEASRGHRQRWSQIHSSRRRSRYGELYHVPDVHRNWSRHDIGMCQQICGIWTLGGTQTPRAGGGLHTKQLQRLQGVLAAAKQVLLFFSVVKKAQWSRCTTTTTTNNRMTVCRSFTLCLRSRRTACRSYHRNAC